MSSIPNNFLGLDAKLADYDKARFAVLPIPYDCTTSYMPGTRNGPAAIITASQHVEEFDADLEMEGYKCGITTLDPLESNVAGAEAMHQEIYRAARGPIRDGKFLFALGGDHSITSALVRATKAKFKGVSVLQLDAHSDLRNSYHGSKYSHACVMRRVHEMGVNIVPVGIRNMAAEEHRYMKKQGISAISAIDCMLDDDWVDRVLDGLGETVYVTLDIDGFDPAYAPGTGTPVPGGLDWYQVTGLLELIASERRIVGADIVEVMPIPGQVVTEFLAAKLAYRLMNLVQLGS